MTIFFIINYPKIAISVNTYTYLSHALKHTVFILFYLIDTFGCHLDTFQASILIIMQIVDTNRS